MTGHPYLHHNLTDLQDAVFLGTQSIISAKTEIRTYPYSFAKHIHKSVELYLIDSGRCCMDINNRQLAFEAGDLVMIYPNIVHSFYMKEPGTCAFRHIHFDPALFSEWRIIDSEAYPLNILATLITPFNRYFHLRADESVSATVDCILKEANEKDALSDALANLHIVQLLIYFIKLTRSGASPSHKDGSPLPHHLQYVSRALSYIHEHYSQKIRTPDIAAHLNISARYLDKIFFQHVNLTILNYTNIYRMNQAIDLMSNTDLTLTSIAAQVGCKDSQHFSKLFKNIIGLPPNQYRKLILHDQTEEE